MLSSFSSFLVTPSLDQRPDLFSYFGHDKSPTIFYALRLPKVYFLTEVNTSPLSSHSSNNVYSWRYQAGGTSLPMLPHPLPTTSHLCPIQKANQTFSFPFRFSVFFLREGIQPHSSYLFLPSPVCQRFFHTSSCNSLCSLTPSTHATNHHRPHFTYSSFPDFFHHTSRQRASLYLHIHPQITITYPIHSAYLLSFNALSLTLHFSPHSHSLYKHLSSCTLRLPPPLPHILSSLLTSPRAALIR